MGKDKYHQTQTNNNSNTGKIHSDININGSHQDGKIVGNANVGLEYKPGGSDTTFRVDANRSGNLGSISPKSGVNTVTFGFSRPF